MGMFENYMEDLNPSNPVTVKEVGFIAHPKHSMFGVSLDGKTSDNGILEIKCRGRMAHLKQFRTIDKINREVSVTAKELLDIAHWQRNWGCYITGATHSYFVGYTDDLPIDNGGLLVKRFERDEELIAQMEEKAMKAAELIPMLAADYKQLISELK